MASRKGIPNKKSLPLLEKAKALGCDPFEILIRFAKGDWKGLGYENECYHMERPDGAVKIGYTITPEMRLKASTEASKYLYPQRKAVELSGSISPELAEAAEKIKGMSKEEQVKLLEEQLRNLKK